VSFNHLDWKVKLSMGWVDPRVGLGYIGSGWVKILQFSMGWIELGRI